MKKIGLEQIFTKGEYVYVVDSNQMIPKGCYFYNEKSGSVFKQDMFESIQNKGEHLIILTNDPSLVGVTQFEVEEISQPIMVDELRHALNLINEAIDNRRNDEISGLKEAWNLISSNITSYEEAKAKQWTDEDLENVIDMARESPLSARQIIYRLCPKIKSIEVEMEEYTINAQSLRDDWKRGERIKLNSNGKAIVKITYGHD